LLKTYRKNPKCKKRLFLGVFYAQSQNKPKNKPKKGYCENETLCEDINEDVAKDGELATARRLTQW